MATQIESGLYNILQNNIEFSARANLTTIFSPRADETPLQRHTRLSYLFIKTATINLNMIGSDHLSSTITVSRSQSQNINLNDLKSGWYHTSTTSTHEDSPCLESPSFRIDFSTANKDITLATINLAKLSDICRRNNVACDINYDPIDSSSIIFMIPSKELVKIASDKSKWPSFTNDYKFAFETPDLLTTHSHQYAYQVQVSQNTKTMNINQARGALIETVRAQNATKELPSIMSIINL